MIRLIFASLLIAVSLPAETPPSLHGLPLVFQEDFEKGRERWEVTDETSWTHRVVDGNAVFGINRRESNYQPPHRSPLHIALLKDVTAADFVLTFKVRSTRDTGNHRDCCVIFNHQDAAHFYYVHLGAKPDPASGQIMIVQNAPRRPLTHNTRPVPWTDGWHQVKVVREVASFDDMNDFDDIRLYAKP